MWEAESRTRLDQRERDTVPLAVVPDDAPLTRTAVANVVVIESVSLNMTDESSSSVSATEQEKRYSSDRGSPMAASLVPQITQDSLHDSNPNPPAPLIALDSMKIEATLDFANITPLLPTSTCQSLPDGKCHHLSSLTYAHGVNRPPDNLSHSLSTPSTSLASQKIHEIIASSDTHTQKASSPPLDLPTSHPYQPEAAAESRTNNTTIVNTDHSRHASSSTSPTHSPSSISPPSLPPVPTGGESIYRTIMNRLTALEANHSLYTRYIEEQTASVRDVLKRLGEDVGRVEAIVSITITESRSALLQSWQKMLPGSYFSPVLQGKSQAQLFQRSLLEWERQKNRLDMQYGELLSRVDYLADEVLLSIFGTVFTRIDACLDRPRKTARYCTTMPVTSSTGFHGVDTWIEWRSPTRASTVVFQTKKYNEGVGAQKLEFQ